MRTIYYLQDSSVHTVVVRLELPLLRIVVKAFSYLRSILSSNSIPQCIGFFGYNMPSLAINLVDFPAFSEKVTTADTACANFL